MRGLRPHRQAAPLPLGLGCSSSWAASRSSTGVQPHNGSSQSRRDGSTCRLGKSRAAGQVGSARTTIGNSSPFASMYGHHANALSALLDDGRVLSLTVLLRRSPCARRRRETRRRRAVRIAGPSRPSAGSSPAPARLLATSQCLHAPEPRPAASSIVWAIGRRLRPTWRRPKRTRASATSWRPARASFDRPDASDGVCVSAVHPQR